jgi:hypothetical protein
MWDSLPQLVGGLEHFFMTFHSVGNVIIPTDFKSIIFQRGCFTTNQRNLGMIFPSFYGTTFWGDDLLAPHW